MHGLGLEEIEAYRWAGKDFQVSDEVDPRIQRGIEDTLRISVNIPMMTHGFSV